MTVTPQAEQRYSRHLLLPEIGASGQQRLQEASVLLIGLGGLGSPALAYLAAAGVGTIGLLDDDRVEESNLQRQVIHRQEDLGRLKVDSAADAAARLNPLITVRRHPQRLTAANAAGLFAEYDLVIDGSDNFDTRYLVNDACEQTRTPWVWGAVLRFEGQVSTFWPGRGPVYRDLFPRPAPPGRAPSCAEAGVLGGVCGIIGSILATEAVKILTGSGESLLGRVLLLDTLAWTWRVLRLRPDPDRPPAPAPVTALTAAELAARLRDRREGNGDFVLIDVRDPEEHSAGTIPGALSIPLADLGSAYLPPDLPIVVHCASGVRSEQAVRLLRERGLREVSHLAGGFRSWLGC
ncbi:molybdopterin-synthase adenylyltransferase MoeB [Kineosporia sp. J2-2]|uniref:Molybdopterin-synthase adenylyltransferase MoeB n=1 Tax=Kineosporia corallincola TaxID=2835133 RepID=A0ABS5TBH5_9ACTN|nr:molybdopterin-synthase adenylyltransferase MoeB [Kineosporia corallincola]MBT0768425.1 molybdopterin-synthase adenylyltransferase MoeB [Kineosporia corallincola]